MAGPAGYSRQGANKNHSDLACRGFTMVELLVVISILSLLMSILIPVLARARGLAKTAVCTSNLRQLGMAFILYANDYDDYTMPTLGQSRTYWWGQILSDGIDHTKGFVWPYLQNALAKNSVNPQVSPTTQSGLPARTDTTDTIFAPRQAAGRI